MSGVGLAALLLAAACMAALLWVALFPATDLPPSETYAVLCVLTCFGSDVFLSRRSPRSKSPR